MNSVSAPLSIARAAGVHRAWLIAAASVAVLAGVFLLYWPSSGSLMQAWGDTRRTSYTHGFVIAGLALWMVFRRREQLAALSWSPSIPASMLVAALGFVWLVAVRGGIEIVHQLLLLALLWLSAWAVFGLRMARELTLPIGYLIFAIPVWDQINFILQEATVRATALLLAVTAIPAYVEGNFVYLAAGEFEIAGGCSGIHFFIVALALATLYGEVGRDSMRVRIWLVALAGALALLSNWLRVYIIIIAGYLTDMQHYLIQKEHVNFGWAVFAAMMLVFLLLARRLAPAIARDIPQPAPDTRVPRTSRTQALVIVGACVLAVPAWDLLRPIEPAVLTSKTAMVAPAGWSSVAPAAFSDWNPVFAGADRLERAEYTRSSGPSVQMFVAAYAYQRQNKELVGYGNSLIGAGEGAVVSSQRASSGVAREVLVQGPHDRSVIRYYYDIGGHRTDRGLVAQLGYGIRAIRRETPSSLVALRAVCATDCDGARALLAEFSASVDAH